MSLPSKAFPEAPHLTTPGMIKIFSSEPPGHSCLTVTELISLCGWLILDFSLGWDWGPCPSFLSGWRHCQSPSPHNAAPNQRKPPLLMPLSLRDKKVAIRHPSVGYGLPGPVRARFSLMNKCSSLNILSNFTVPENKINACP